MRTKINCVRVRSDLNKSKSFKKRNWPKYMEKFTNKTGNIAEDLNIQTNIGKKQATPKIKNKLERSPAIDIMDFSGEEEGFFELNGKIISTIFPR